MVKVELWTNLYDEYLGGAVDVTFIGNTVVVNRISWDITTINIVEYVEL